MFKLSQESVVDLFIKLSSLDAEVHKKVDKICIPLDLSTSIVTSLNSNIEEVLESIMTNLDKAIKLTEDVFDGMLDKGGVTYFEHCKRVCDIAVKRYNINEDEQCAAYLHDVLEDTNLTENDLREYGFSERTIELVKKLTRPDGITYMEYIRRIANSGDRGLIFIKLADNEDNSDPIRINNLPESERSIVKRYEKARKILLEGLKYD